jgi:phosphoethanolamine N-methyltransferase
LQGELARTAAHVTAVDFMPNLIEENERTHGRCKNVAWRCGDATELAIEKGSFDVVFSNWLLMYLADEEVAKLASDMLGWVGTFRPSLG